MAEAITEMVLPSTYIEVRAEGLIGVSGIVTGNVGVVGTASRGTGRRDGRPLDRSPTRGRSSATTTRGWTARPDELTLVRALQQVFGNGGSTVYAVRTAARRRRGRRRAR